MTKYRGYDSLDADARQWVDDTLAGLDAAGRIAQVLAPFVTSWGSPDENPIFLEPGIEARVGVAFLTPGHDLAAQRDAARQMQAACDIPPLFCSDYEFGPTVDGAVKFPAAMAAGAIADGARGEELAYQAGAAAARQAAATGVTWTFSPVIDLPLDPDSPVTHMRAYHRDSDRIIALANAYIRGCQEHGMAATVKHFPGDGADRRDQHLVTVSNPLSAADWRARYGRCYAETIEAGVMTVMPGHIAQRELASRDADGRALPASIDRVMLEDVLRGELGFEGLIVSDAINMFGVRNRCTDTFEACIRAFNAGCDVVLFPPHAPTTAEAFAKALSEGTISEDRLEQAVRRVLSLKAALGLHRRNPLCSDEQIPAVLNDPAAEQTSRDVSAEALTLLRGDGRVPMKLQPGDRVLVVDAPNEQARPSEIELAGGDGSCQPLTEALRRRGLEPVVVRTIQELNQNEPDCQAVIYVFNVRPSAFRGSVRLSWAAISCLNYDVILSPKPVACLAAGNPFGAWELEPVPNVVCTYGDAPACQEAAVAALLGEADFPGTLPVELPITG